MRIEAFGFIHRLGLRVPVSGLRVLGLGEKFRVEAV